MINIYYVSQIIKMEFIKYFFYYFIIQNIGFCGQSIKVKVKCLGNKKTRVFGRFICENDYDDIEVNDVLSYNVFNTENCEDNSFYHSYEIIPNEYYEINQKLKSWNLSMSNIRDKKISFNAYLCIVEKRKYKCVAKCTSPSFLVCSSRRNDLAKICTSNINIEINPEEKKETNSDLNKYSHLLRDLSDDTIISHSKTNNDKRIIKDYDMFSIPKMFYELQISEPNTEYFDPINQFSIKKINTILTSTDREEISFRGTIGDYELDYTYLDRYGNVFKVPMIKSDE